MANNRLGILTGAFPIPSLPNGTLLLVALLILAAQRQTMRRPLLMPTLHHNGPRMDRLLSSTWGIAFTGLAPPAAG